MHHAVRHSVHHSSIRPASACGCGPAARIPRRRTLGINVYKMRYAGVTISGALAGIGGFVYAMTTANCTSNGDVAGFGFLALAVMIFGNWKPLNIAGRRCCSACSKLHRRGLYQPGHQRRRRVPAGQYRHQRPLLSDAAVSDYPARCWPLPLQEVPAPRPRASPTIRVSGRRKALYAPNTPAAGYLIIICYILFPLF